jgi:hypothetical protein
MRIGEWKTSRTGCVERWMDLIPQRKMLVLLSRQWGGRHSNYIFQDSFDGRYRTAGYSTFRANMFDLSRAWCLLGRHAAALPNAWRPIRIVITNML